MNPIDKKELFGHVQKLPALSAVVMRLLATIDQDEIDVDSIARQIGQDQAITVKTLRLANSSFYGMQHKISNIGEAINVLGFKNVRMLVASSAISDSFSRAKPGHFNYGSFWQHSTGTAICAKEIACCVGANQEVAFIAGLIHDIGKLVLVTHYPHRFDRALEYQIQNGCELETAEQNTMGMDHGEISAAVIRHWNFPEKIQMAISMQHLDDDDPSYALSRIIHLASALAWGLDFSNDPSAVVPVISQHVWRKLNLDEQQCHRIFSEALRKFEELSQSLVN